MGKVLNIDYEVFFVYKKWMKEDQACDFNLWISIMLLFFTDHTN